MVLFTPEKQIFKGSKKQHQILAQTAYYQAGKIVVQTILPEQPPVALITLNTLGTTCSTSADTYIPIENIFNTQSCSSLESRLVGLYGGKAASLLIEYEQHLKFLNQNNNSSLSDSSNDSFSLLGIPRRGNRSSATLDSSLVQNKSSIYPYGVRVVELTPSGYRSQVNTIPSASARVIPSEFFQNSSNATLAPRIVVRKKYIPFHFNTGGPSKEGLTKQSSFKGALLSQRGQRVTKQKIGKQSQAGTKTKLINNVARVRSQVFNFSELTFLPKSLASEWKPNGKNRLVRTCFAGAGNNIFQSTLGNIEIQTATRLARIMVNYWNFYSINKISLYSLVKKYAPAHNSSSLLCVPLWGNRSSATLDSSFNDYVIPRAVARERILPCKSTIFHFSGASARLELLRSSSAARLAPPAFYKSKNFEGINNWESKNSSEIPYPVKGKTFHANNANGSCQTSVWSSLFARGQQLKDQKQKDLSYILKEESVAKELEAEGDAKRKCNVRVWGTKLKVRDKTPQGNIIYKYKIAKLNSGYPIPRRGKGVCEARNNLYFAIAQSKNSLKICENKNSSYNIQRISIENIGNYSQLNNNNFQLINSLQFSHLQRDRFYPNWFRLYLPDMEATEFLKNIANYYFSLGLQTLTFPSAKSNYSSPSRGALEKLNVSTASPFLSFLNKNTQKEKYKLFLPNISSYTYCPPAILINSPSVKFINLHNKLTPPTKMKGYGVRGQGAKQEKWYFSQRNTSWVAQLTPHLNEPVRDWKAKLSIPRRGKGSRIHFSGARDTKDPNFTKVEGVRLDPLNVPFSLLLESQIFPLNYNDFSLVEKELLYNTLVNSSFAKAFYLINQNRQLLDFFVDYLLRFQILRQHQILYLFSTLLLGCNKTA